jgi:hypothetical protein
MEIAHACAEAISLIFDNIKAYTQIEKSTS